MFLPEILTAVLEFFPREFKQGFCRTTSREILQNSFNISYCSFPGKLSNSFLEMFAILLYTFFRGFSQTIFRANLGVSLKVFPEVSSEISLTCFQSFWRSFIFTPMPIAKSFSDITHSSRDLFRSLFHYFYSSSYRSSKQDSSISEFFQFFRYRRWF